MQIGKLAKRAGISVDTVRYYEKSGLLPPALRQPNGYRSFGEPHLAQLAFVRHCRALDMSLGDVRQLLGLLTNPGADCGTVDRLIDDQLARVQNQIASLQKLELQLKTLRTQCNTQASVSQCGILQELVSATHSTL